MAGLYNKKLSLFARRLITIIPALVLLFVGVEPTVTLLLSQVALSFGIPFALVPLTVMTADRTLMGVQVNSRKMTIAVCIITGLVSVLNIALILMTVI